MSVWNDIADTPPEAENLRVRSELIMAIEKRITERGWTEVRTAEELNLSLSASSMAYLPTRAEGFRARLRHKGTVKPRNDPYGNIFDGYVLMHGDEIACHLFHFALVTGLG